MSVCVCPCLSASVHVWPCLSASVFLSPSFPLSLSLSREHLYKQIRVADFGLSVDLAGGRPNSRVGTLDYMAPEVIMCGRSSDSIARAVLEQAEKLESGNDDPTLSPVSVVPDEITNLEAASKVASIHAKVQSEGYSVQVRG